MKIVQIKHVLHVAIIWRLFFLKTDQSEPLECSHISKKFILICISKKNKSLTIATCITCLIYMISMHFQHKNSTNLSIHIKHVESLEKNHVLVNGV
jgi:hypothetical protein